MKGRTILEHVSSLIPFSVTSHFVNGLKEA
jgi:hypothetical protein